jgi:hypothetical protein
LRTVTDSCLCRIRVTKLQLNVKVYSRRWAHHEGSRSVVPLLISAVLLLSKKEPPIPITSIEGWVGAGTGLGILDKRIWNTGSSSRQRYKPYNLISSLYFILHFTSHIHILIFFSKTYPCLLFPFQYHFPNYAVSPSGLLSFVFFCMCFLSLPNILQFTPTKFPSISSF